MWYLFLQMWFWIVLSFILGWFMHWYLCCRKKDIQDQPTPVATASSQPKTEVTEAKTTIGASGSEVAAPIADEPSIDATWKPAGLADKPLNDDDLKRIRGIGKVNEKALNELGIYQFAQIASWSEENIKWVEGFLAFPGRISRESWVEQAKTLAEGGSTAFAEKVDKGEVDYD